MTDSTPPPGPTAMVLVSLRMPAKTRQHLMVRAAQETARRGKRVSVNSLILEAIELVEQVEKERQK